MSALLFDEFLDNEAPDRIAGVTLLRVCLDYDAAVEAGRMVVLVLAREVGVYSVTHVRADKERTRHGLRVCAGRGREALEEEGDEGRLGTRRGDGTDLLVVEEGDAVHVAFESSEAIRAGKSCDGLNGTVSIGPGEWCKGGNIYVAYDENWLSIRGLKTSSLFRPPSTEG